MSPGTTPPRASDDVEREDLNDALNALTRTVTVLLSSGVPPYTVVGALAVGLGSAIRGLPAAERAPACEAFMGVVERKALTNTSEPSA